MLLSKTLRDIGYDVSEAGDGRAALDLILKDKYALDLVLADWNMPEMNGLDLVKAVRQDPELDPLVFVMVTTETEIDQMTAALEAGANEYVMKPFTKDILVGKLQLAGIAV
jgi:two-component system chemotaxis response regulator CheY